MNFQRKPSYARACCSLQIQWRFIFAIVIRCYRLRLWVCHFTYFKITHVFFKWMFFNLIKEICRLLNNVFNSLKEINRLRKKINRLLSKRMSNIFLQVTIEMFSKLRFSGFKKFATGSILESSSSRRYHWIFKIFGAKLCVAFLLR